MEALYQLAKRLYGHDIYKASGLIEVDDEWRASQWNGIIVTLEAEERHQTDQNHEGYGAWNLGTMLVKQVETRTRVRELYKKYWTGLMPKSFLDEVTFSWPFCGWGMSYCPDRPRGEYVTEEKVSWIDESWARTSRKFHWKGYWTYRYVEQVRRFKPEVKPLEKHRLDGKTVSPLVLMREYISTTGHPLNWDGPGVQYFFGESRPVTYSKKVKTKTANHQVVVVPGQCVEKFLGMVRQFEQDQAEARKSKAYRGRPRKPIAEASQCLMHWGVPVTYQVVNALLLRAGVVHRPLNRTTIYLKLREAGLESVARMTGVCTSVWGEPDGEDEAS